MCFIHIKVLVVGFDLRSLPRFSSLLSSEWIMLSIFKFISFGRLFHLILVREHLAQIPSVLLQSFTPATKTSLGARKRVKAAEKLDDATSYCYKLFVALRELIHQKSVMLESKNQVCYVLL